MSDSEELLVIDGEQVRAASGRFFETLDPATEEPLAQVAEGDATDIDLAVGAARRALSGPWAKLRPSERGRLLYQLAALIRERQDELVELESRDAGKPITSIRRQDLPAVIDTLTYYAGWADKLHGDTLPIRDDAVTYTMREPIGVVGVIVPWNFPLMIAMWKVAPALACGCTVVLKPAELTPLTALRLGRLALEAGFPPGVLNVVPGFGTTAGRALVEHQDVDYVTFTGSPGVGREILRGAAGNLKRVTLELGGKSANVVFDDVDISQAVRAAASGIFFNAGQVCSAGSRIIAHEKVYDEVVERLAERAQSIRVGPPQQDKTIMGPIISEKQMTRVLGYVEAGSSEGAALVTGGERVGDVGYFVAPTVFANVEQGMRIAQEEIFGPVVSVLRFSDEEQAVEIANGTSYNLAAAVWSTDVKRVHRVIKALNAGTVWANTFGFTDVRLPWGGAGDSGFGREHGTAALENYTAPKAVWLNLNP